MRHSSRFPPWLDRADPRSPLTRLCYASATIELDGRKPASSAQGAAPARPALLQKGMPLIRSGANQGASSAASPGPFGARQLHARPRDCRQARGGQVPAQSPVDRSDRRCHVPRGEMTEWPKVPDSKSGVSERVPWVRLPLSPQRRPRSASRISSVAEQAGPESARSGNSLLLSGRASGAGAPRAAELGSGPTRIHATAEGVCSRPHSWIGCEPLGPHLER